MTPALELDGVGLRFGKGPERLTDIALSLAPGSVATLGGPAGSGKTLLLEVAALARRASRGRVRLFGQDCLGSRPEALAPVRRRIGRVEAIPMLDPALDPATEAGLPLRLAGVDREEAQRRVGEMLAWLDGEAGSGSRPILARNVALARAVIAGPELVLVDEVTGFPAPQRLRLMHLIARLSRQGVAFLLSSRDEAVLAAIPATARLHLTDGRLDPDMRHG